MDKNIENFVKYSPIIIVIMGFFISYHIFVTPTELDDKLDTLSAKIEQKYATKTETAHQQKQLDDISKKLDKIYDILINKK